MEREHPFDRKEVLNASLCRIKSGNLMILLCHFPDVVYLYKHRFSKYEDTLFKDLYENCENINQNSSVFEDIYKFIPFYVTVNIN